MTSVSERLRNKRLAQRIRAGRPKKQGMERYPSGRIKAGETAKEVKSVALEARARVHGVSESVVDGIDLAGYTLGRMFLDGKIDKVMLDAGDWFTLRVNAHYRLNGLSYPNAKAQNLLAVRGMDGEESLTMREKARRATNLFMRLNCKVKDQRHGNEIWLTLFNVCIKDEENLRMMPSHQLEWLRKGLMTLHFEKGLSDG